MPVKANSLLQRVGPMHPHTYPFLFENRDVYLQFGLPATRVRWKQSPKTHLFKNALWSRVFENAGFSFTCGQTKMEVFKYVDFIHHILLAWHMLWKGCFRISIISAFLCGQAKMIWIRYVWIRIFWKGRKKSVFKNILMPVDGAIIDVLIITR